jgi:hypothetical protein
VVIAVDVVVAGVVVGRVEGEGEAGVAAGVGEGIALAIGAAEVAEAARVPQQVGVEAAAELVDIGDDGLQARLGAVQGGVGGGAEVEAVVDVVADRLVAGVGPARRRRVEGAVAGVEDVGRPLVHGLVGALEPLQDDGRGHVRGTEADLQGLQAQREGTDRGLPFPPLWGREAAELHVCGLRRTAGASRETKVRESIFLRVGWGKEFVGQAFQPDFRRVRLSSSKWEAAPKGED